MVIEARKIERTSLRALLDLDLAEDQRRLGPELIKGIPFESGK